MSSAVIRQERDRGEGAAGAEWTVQSDKHPGGRVTKTGWGGASVTPDFSSLAPQTRPGPHTTCPVWMMPHSRGLWPVFLALAQPSTEPTLTRIERSHEDQAVGERGASERQMPLTGLWTPKWDRLCLCAWVCVYQLTYCHV